MNEYAHRLMEVDLEESFGVATPPDLTASVLARLEDSPAIRLLPADEPEGRVVQGPWRGIGLRLLQAACLLLAVGITAWLAWPQEKLPQGVMASADAEVEVHEEYVELSEGWLALEKGAPSVRVGDGRVDEIRGRVVVAAGGRPDQGRLDRLVRELELTKEEAIMLKDPKRWLTAGGMALCVLSGSVLWNGEIVEAGKEKNPVVRADGDENDDVVLRVTGDGLLTGALRVERFWQGNDSGIQDRQTVLITNAKEFTEFWSRHRPKGSDADCPEVDFKKHCLLMLFGGKGTEFVGLKRTWKSGRTIVARCEYEIAEEEARDASFGYGFYELPMPGKEIQNFQVEVMGPTPPGGNDTLWKVQEEFAFRSAPTLGNLPELEPAWTGKSCNIKEEEYHLVRTDEAWQALWARMGIKMQAYEVDFEKYTLLAVFEGRGEMHQGTQIQEILRDGSELRLRLQGRVGQVMEGAPVYSGYSLYLLDKDEDLPIRIEEYSRAGETVYWREVARLGEQ